MELQTNIAKIEKEFAELNTKYHSELKNQLMISQQMLINSKVFN
jgi:hypothetical protein